MFSCCTPNVIFRSYPEASWRYMLLPGSLLKCVCSVPEASSCMYIFYRSVFHVVECVVWLFVSIFSLLDIRVLVSCFMDFMCICVSDHYIRNARKIFRIVPKQADYGQIFNISHSGSDISYYVLCVIYTIYSFFSNITNIFWYLLYTWSLVFIWLKFEFPFKLTYIYCVTIQRIFART